LIWCVLSCSTVTALDGQLSAELDTTTTSWRTSAPLDSTWKLQWLGPSILEGQLAIRVREEKLVRAQCRSHDLVLSTGEQRVRVRIPSLGSRPFWTPPEIDLTFVTETETIDLGSFTLTGRPNRRAFAICVCRGRDDRPSAVAEQWIKSLDLEEFVTDGFPAHFYTSRTHWGRDDIPTNAIRFCAFDVVFATSEGFASLRSKQLEALDRWVRAGGSLGILAGDDLPLAQSNYLNELAVDVDEPIWLSDGTMAPAARRLFANGTWLTNRGLGRIAVIDNSGADKRRDDPKSRRGLACHLWRVRKEHVAQIVSGSPLDSEDSVDNEVARLRAIQRQMAMSNQWSATGTQQLLENLMPRDVQIVPVTLLATILVGYVVLIGPVDYVGLGWLRMRRWTWVTFPLVTVATALFCLKMSHVFLSSQDTGHSLTVRDVDEGGHVVRESRIQLVFTSTRQDVKTHVKNGFFTVMDHQRMNAMNFATPYGRPTGASEVEVPKFQGSIPADFQVTQLAPQWTPLLNRTLSIPSEDEVVPFPWEEVEPLVTTGSGHQELASLVVSSFGDHSTAIVFHRDEHFEIRRDVLARRSHRAYDPRYGSVKRPTVDFADSIWDHISKRPGSGVFSLISRVSCHGGDSFEDLAMLDPTDPS